MIESQIANSSFFHFSQCDKSDKLIIVFSAASAKSFTGFKLLSNLKCNKLFIRDPNRSWYQSAVPKHWNDADELIAKIETITSQFNSADIICTGGSMGGYAALLVGAKINAGKVVAFSPQLKIDKPFPNCPSSKIKLSYPELSTIIKQAGNTEFTIYNGTEDLLSYYHTKEVQSLSHVDINWVRYAPHNVMGYLHKNKKLVTILFDQIEKKVTNDFTSYIFEDDNIPSQLGGIVEDYYLKKDQSKIISELEKVLPKVADLALPYHLLGKIKADNSCHGNALEWYQKALLYGESDDALLFDMGLSSIQIKDYDSAQGYFTKAIEVCGGPVPIYDIKLGATYMLKGEYELAMEMQLKALEFDPSRGHAYYQLAIVCSKLGYFDDAYDFFKEAERRGDKTPTLKKHIKTIKNKLGNINNKQVGFQEKIDKLRKVVLPRFSYAKFFQDATTYVNYDENEAYSSVEKLCINIGAGNFYHPKWVNLDVPSEHYKHVQKNITECDLTKLVPLPFDSESVALAYTSHVIEHVKNDAVANMFQEVFRVLQPGGVFRITCPNADTFYYSIERNDYSAFWTRKKLWFPNTDLITPFNFLINMTSCGLGKRIKDEPTFMSKVEYNYKLLPKSEFLDWLTTFSHFSIAETAFHINWWNYEKIKQFLHHAGFRNVFVSSFGASVAAPMRNLEKFDNTCIDDSVYVEAVK